MNKTQRSSNSKKKHLKYNNNNLKSFSQIKYLNSNNQLPNHRCWI